MSQESEKGAIISPTFHHFGVLTTRLEEMMDWYAKVLGMKTNSSPRRVGLPLSLTIGLTTAWR